jgi:hypothetical protein
LITTATSWALCAIEIETGIGIVRRRKKMGFRNEIEIQREKSVGGWMAERKKDKNQPINQTRNKQIIRENANHYSDTKPD